MIYNSKLIIGLLVGGVLFTSGFGYVYASNNTSITNSTSNNTSITSPAFTGGGLTIPSDITNTEPAIYPYYGKDYTVHTDVTSQQLKDIRSLHALQINWAIGNLTLNNFTSPAYKPKLLNETKYLGDLYQYDELLDAKLTLQDLENKTTIWVIPASQTPLLLMEGNLLNSTEAAASSSHSATARDLSPIVYYPPVPLSDVLLGSFSYLATIIGLVIAAIALGIFLAYRLHKIKKPQPQ